METAEVRKRIKSAIERAKRGAADRRARTDEAARAFEVFLDRTAVPMFRQVENILRAEGYSFELFTPAGAVRLMSGRSSEDYIELGFDSAAAPPSVVAHIRRSRGRRVHDAEHVLGDPASLGDEEVLAFLVKEIEPFVER